MGLKYFAWFMVLEMSWSCSDVKELSERGIPLARPCKSQKPHPENRRDVAPGIPETSPEVFSVQGCDRTSRPRVEYFSLDAQASELNNLETH
jgi:hypothetical protein